MENSTRLPDRCAAALFVSDVHLQETMPRTTQAFIDFLRLHAIHSHSVYLLGDLFEAWPGDDDLGSPYNRVIVDALRRLHDAGVALFWIAGNRDFLVGPDFAAATGAILLPDPSLITIGERGIILTHGDAQCTDDADYMAFRQTVRQSAWQQQFLGMPLQERKAVAARLRSGSKEAQRMKSSMIMDVNAAAIDALFEQERAATLIHGHTHRPACHRGESNGRERVRLVLPDWDCEGSTARGGWIAADAAGMLRCVGLDGSASDAV